MFEECFSEEIIVPDCQLTNEQFRSIVVGNVLADYHENQEMVYSEENKEHIRRVVLLDSFGSPSYQIETAKISFVEILQELGREVSVNYMEVLRLQWSEEENQESIFH